MSFKLTILHTLFDNTVNIVAPYYTSVLSFQLIEDYGGGYGVGDIVLWYLCWSSTQASTLSPITPRCLPKLSFVPNHECCDV